MEIINHQLMSDGNALAELPRLAVNALVKVWSVPTEYQASGYFVSTDNTIPACNHGEPVFIGELEADADAVMAAEQQRLIATITAEAQQRLDVFAQSRTYDDVSSMSKYKDFTDADLALLPDNVSAIIKRYRAECKYLLLKTAETWAVLEIIMIDVLSGNRPMPTGIDDISLPVLEWPL